MSSSMPGRAPRNIRRMVGIMGFLRGRRHRQRDRCRNSKVKQKIAFAVPGLSKEAIQRLDCDFPDGKRAFVALGPANRIAVIDTRRKRSRNIFWSASAFGNCFYPDAKYLYTTNGFQTMSRD